MARRGTLPRCPHLSRSNSHPAAEPEGQAALHQPARQGGAVHFLPGAGGAPAGCRLLPPPGHHPALPRALAAAPQVAAPPGEAGRAGCGMGVEWSGCCRGQECCGLQGGLGSHPSAGSGWSGLQSHSLGGGSYPHTFKGCRTRLGSRPSRLAPRSPLTACFTPTRPSTDLGVCPCAWHGDDAAGAAAPSGAHGRVEPQLAGTRRLPVVLVVRRAAGARWLSLCWMRALHPAAQCPPTDLPSLQVGVVALCGCMLFTLRGRIGMKTVLPASAGASAAALAGPKHH